MITGLNLAYIQILFLSKPYFDHSVFMGFSLSFSYFQVNIKPILLRKQHAISSKSLLLSVFNTKLKTNGSLFQVLQNHPTDGLPVVSVELYNRFRVDRQGASLPLEYTYDQRRLHHT